MKQTSLDLLRSMKRTSLDLLRPMKRTSLDLLCFYEADLSEIAALL